MKCEHCGSDMVWQGSMLDGDMTCTSCVAIDCQESWSKEANFGCIVIDDPLAIGDVPRPGDDYIVFEEVSLFEWQKALEKANSATPGKLFPYYYKLNNGRYAILSPEAGSDYEDWLSMGGCSCHTGCAPCSYCAHPGHPDSLENRDDCKLF